MGLFDNLFGKGKAQEQKSEVEEKATSHIPAEAKSATESKSHLGSKDIINMMVMTAEMAMNDGNYEQAVENYRNILRLEPNETAQYNLGSLYAQGKGIKQDFMEGAYWFRQAELSGDEQAGKLCLKCSVDYTNHNLDRKNAEQLYTDMVKFIRHVFPEIADVNLEVCRKLYAIAGNHFNNKNYVAAAKLFRAAAEFGHDGYSQNYLAVLYNAGAGVEKNDLASLYWFDKAVDNGAADVAQKDRDGMLNAYKKNFTPSEFYEAMMDLVGWCSVGSKDVPKDADKAAFWREIGETAVSDASGKKA